MCGYEKLPFIIIFSGVGRLFPFRLKKNKMRKIRKRYAFGLLSYSFAKFLNEGRHECWRWLVFLVISRWKNSIISYNYIEIDEEKKIVLLILLDLLQPCGRALYYPLK